MKKTTIYLVRHAQSEHNRKWIATDEEPGKQPMERWDSWLTEAGKRQAVTLARKLEHYPIDCILASHLNRARQTAEILGETLSLPIQTTEMLQERLTRESEQEAGTRLFTFLQDTAHQWREKTSLLSAMEPFHALC